MAQIVKLWFVVVVLVLLGSSNLLAHHSFSPYDVYNPPVVMSGVVESWEWRQPHPVLKFRASSEYGGCLWTMEVATRRWQNAGVPTDAIKEGDEMAVMGWPKRDSTPEMVFGAFEIKGQDPIVFQATATGNSAPPSDDVVITRPVCDS